MRYKFSIVMAVYNVEPFLREAIDSVIAQDIGFEHVQLILVNDGSTDSSGTICDEYAAKHPDNILVLHKPNGGVSSARNLGLEHIQGEYVNFLDADDKLSKNALREVYSFFTKHYEETDMVTIPIHFFDAYSGSHDLNYKFDEGTRVIDLKCEWNHALFHINSTFTKPELYQSFRFDPRLTFAEDAQLIQLILSRKQTLGVVASAKYWYRKRSTGELSAIQGSKTKRGWYLACLTYFHQFVLEWYMSHFHNIPRFIQYTIMHDLRWRWMDRIPNEVLTESEKQQYISSAYRLLAYIDDDVILAQKTINAVIKMALLCRKHRTEPQIANGAIWAGKNTSINLSAFPFHLCFMEWHTDSIVLEGLFELPKASYCSVDLTVSVNDQMYTGSVFTTSKSTHILEEDTSCTYGFRVEVPIKDNQTITFHPVVNGFRYNPDHMIFGKFFPVGNAYRHAYCIKSKQLLTVNAHSLRICRARWYDYILHEPKYLAEIWKTNALGGRKSIPVRLAYPILKLLKRKPLWLISDRASKAGDNGEALFRYIREHHPEIDIRFVINSHCPDYHAMAKIGPVLGFRSLKHKLLAPVADYVISSHGEGKIYNPFDGYSEPYRDLLADTKYVFLQHGITKDDISGWLNRYNTNFSGFVTSAGPEYESVAKGKYAYPTEAIWLTGFPRFDRLYHAERKQITIMPTWRKYLMNNLDINTGTWSIIPGFENSDYVRFYSALLSNQRLMDSAKRLGYQIAFFPHPNTQMYLHHFRIHSDVKLLGQETNYKDVYAHSNLVVTDYSSSVFDFAYLRKPVLYVQFDSDVFFSGIHCFEKGYFDYERDGFGEVEYDLEGTINRIIDYMENGCQLKEKYRQRIENFFAFHDQNNCKRVFKRINELDS